MNKEWLSGFFDAEGCVRVGCISQKNTTILDEIKSSYGGRINHQVGCSSLYFRAVERLFFYRDILPYLQIKFDRIKEKLEHLEMRYESGVLGKSGHPIRYVNPINIQKNKISNGWLSGFFDGEGYCNDNGVYITQKNPDVLNEIREIYGGKLYKIPCGYSWVIHGRDSIIKFSDAVLPYLKLKTYSLRKTLQFIPYRGIKEKRQILTGIMGYDLVFHYQDVGREFRLFHKEVIKEYQKRWYLKKKRNSADLLI